MSDKRIEALTKAAKRKKKEALAKTEQAIQDLIKKKHKITIRSVAREAGVSVSYIYKHHELVKRIQHLKARQKSDSVQPQSPLSKSSQVITNQLHNRITLLEQEKEKLSQEITTLTSNVYEIDNSNNIVESLKAENLRLLKENHKLKQQLANTEQKLLQSRDFILSQGYKNISQNNF
ncbi:MAG: DUF6262 family protein [Xenococcus sp. (in: cyanobacteria)]